MMKQHVAIWRPKIAAAFVCLALILSASVAVNFPAAAGPKAAPANYDDAWKELKYDVFADQEILDGADLITLKAPYRAHDAAIVPITISAKQSQDPQDYIKSITLIIDKNPAPVAAVFKMSPDSGIATLSTRIRVNMYSYVRAIAETNSGKLYMAKSFVKAAGGCSAPAGKDQAEALANLGKMKLRQFSPIPATPNNSTLIREAQLMIRHPNHSGLAMDQVTGLYIPAHFVQSVEIKRGDKKILSVEGNISLSEDPSLRFHFTGDENSVLTAHIVDTEGKKFTKTWKVRTPPKEGS